MFSMQSSEERTCLCQFRHSRKTGIPCVDGAKNFLATGADGEHLLGQVLQPRLDDRVSGRTQGFLPRVEEWAEKHNSKIH